MKDELTENRKIIICPCCKCENVKKFMKAYTLNSSGFHSKTLTSTKFYHKPYFCLTCSHIFNQTPMTTKKLEAYYYDQILQVVEDYSIEKRLSVIKKCSGKNNLSKILDFGGNSKLSFHKALEELGFEVEIMEIGYNIPNKKFDIITAYFVLEHLVDLDSIIKMFSNLLSESGSLIIEVPDANLYNVNYNGLQFEHQHHFQPHSLRTLLNRHKFIESYSSSDDCSRNFGFVSTFKKVKYKYVPEKTRSNLIKKYISAKKKYFTEDDFPKRYFKRFSNISVIVLWGVNTYFEQIIKSQILIGKKIIAVDIDPNKKKIIDKFGYLFFSPIEFIKSYFLIIEDLGIQNDNIEIVITASTYFNSIKKQLAIITDRVNLYSPNISK